MSQHFTLDITRVECRNEQRFEWGKDEMRLFAFAVSRTGQFFATGYRELGSYGTGDVHSDGIFPMRLVDAQLADDSLEVLFYVWLVEEDGGGVRDSAVALRNQMEQRFRDAESQLAQVGLPRTCIPFTAFYKAALPMQLEIEEAGTKGRNDEVYSPFELVINRPTDGVVAIGPRSGVFALERSKRLGHYRVDFRFTYTPIDVAIS